MNPTIYTYYDEIGVKHQEELLSLWKKSWEQKGFNSKILTKTHALRSDYYNTFIKDLQSLYESITNSKIKRYGLACYERWIAYSTVNDDSYFFVSDFDVLNLNFTLELSSSYFFDKISFLNHYCPCFVSGTSDQFLLFCKEFINFLTKNALELANAFKAAQLNTFHDQDYLWLVHKLQHNFNKIKDMQFLCTPLDCNILVKTPVELYTPTSVVNKVPLIHLASISIDSSQRSAQDIYNLKLKIAKTLIH